MRVRLLFGWLRAWFVVPLLQPVQQRALQLQ
jgi:hypothetical protein